jgi:hypothetical protein
MNMVRYAADSQRRTLPLLKDSCLIGKQTIPMFFRDQRLSMFRAIHQMHQVFDKGLRHDACLAIVPPFQGLLFFRSLTHQGVALGWFVSALSGR